MAIKFTPALLKRKSIILVVLLLLTAFLIIAHPISQWVKAQVAGQSLSVSPPTQEISADPGSTIKVKAKIRNGSNQNLPIQVSIQGFIASGDEGQVALTNNNTYSVSNWTTVEPQSFSLAPGTDKEVTATITIPKDAAGGRYGSFLFGVKPPSANGSAATISQQVASLFLLKINGPTKENLTISEFKAPKFQEFGPVPFTLKFSNRGNIHVKVYGLINITDMFGNTTQNVVVKARNVFPNADRIATATLSKTFLIGKYTATALMYFGSKNELITQSTTFYVFPIRIVIAVIIVLFFIYVFRKRLIKAIKALTGK